MERKLIITGDGSHSVLDTETESTFHSKFGALQESMHVFIREGLRPVMARSQRTVIFEMGFGTGLNAWLTLLGAGNHIIAYTAVEAFPLEKNILCRINYCEHMNRPELQPLFQRMHDAEWEKEVAVTPYFSLLKIRADFRDYHSDQQFDLIYYDAFAPAVQPELWTEPIFHKLFSMLVPGAVLLTYCSKSSVQKAMRAAGFSIEKIPGPPHKREILRAIVPGI